jgi:hypothetical protein
LKADPSLRDHAHGQSHPSFESASIQIMREMHRASELRRLKQAISKGKPVLNGSHTALVDEAILVSTASTDWSKSPRGECAS